MAIQIAMISKLFKIVFGGITLIGVGLLFLAVWRARDINHFKSITPAERAMESAEESRLAAVREKERLASLVGTDCEKLNADECFAMREEKRRIDEHWKQVVNDPEWQRQQEARQQAYDDAGTR